MTLKKSEIFFNMIVKGQSQKDFIFKLWYCCGTYKKMKKKDEVWVLISSQLAVNPYLVNRLIKLSSALTKNS